jgi:signal transduction histidine kinase
MYGFRSYISVPIRLPHGHLFGTLCAIDPHAARLNTPETVGMFRMFADLIAFHLDAQRRLALSEASLTDERESADLREQFIAVLGHDLRNPLASIDAGAHMLLRTPLDERATSIVGLMQNSVRRMAGLIDNILDFARGRLGGGLHVQRDDRQPLQPALEHVINELRSAWPQRSIEARLELSVPVMCDRARVAQLLSNLLSNALTHGAPSTPVTVEASTHDDSFELSVTNAGTMIPPALLGKLFLPFVRASVQPAQEGLGLGLYIASEIARAHNGTLSATSDEAATRFTFRMPLR